MSEFPVWVIIFYPVLDGEFYPDFVLYELSFEPPSHISLDCNPELVSIGKGVGEVSFSKITL